MIDKRDTHLPKKEPSTITIIAPAWNGLPFLWETTESVLCQDHPDWKWVISDDGSTDGSRDYLLGLEVGWGIPRD
jgi:glycosyltransferase involved in cell wall biosynthesis